METESFWNVRPSCNLFLISCVSYFLSHSYESKKNEQRAQTGGTATNRRKQRMASNSEFKELKK